MPIEVLQDHISLPKQVKELAKYIFYPVFKHKTGFSIGLNMPDLHFGQHKGSSPVISLHTSIALSPCNTGRKVVFPIRSKQTESLDFILHIAKNPKYLTL